MSVAHKSIKEKLSIWTMKGLWRALVSVKKLHVSGSKDFVSYMGLKPFRIFRPLEPKAAPHILAHITKAQGVHHGSEIVTYPCYQVTKSCCFSKMFEQVLSVSRTRLPNFNNPGAWAELKILFHCKLFNSC